jgi:hypothetical protein
VHIDAKTKVGPLLDAYPDLEDVLIGIAPPFRKLKNPLLRRSVAKVASLKHVAAVGRVPLDGLLNKLRIAVGQEPVGHAEGEESGDYFSEQPTWFDKARVVRTIDELADTPADTMALPTVAKAAESLGEGDILELVTTFLPAPGIDIMRDRGFRVWSLEEDPQLIRTYFMKRSA